MSGYAVFRWSVLLTGFLLGAGGVAEARIAQAPAPAAPMNLLTEAPAQAPSAPLAADPTVTKTITLNFGPLHFQEVFKASPKSCRS